MTAVIPKSQVTAGEEEVHRYTGAELLALIRKQERLQKRGPYKKYSHMVVHTVKLPEYQHKWLRENPGFSKVLRAFIETAMIKFGNTESFRVLSKNPCSTSSPSSPASPEYLTCAKCKKPIWVGQRYFSAVDPEYKSINDNRVCHVECGRLRIVYARVE